jgi:putative hydrolase of the HAD superfamily
LDFPLYRLDSSNASKKIPLVFIEQYRCDSHREVRAKNTGPLFTVISINVSNKFIFRLSRNAQPNSEIFNYVLNKHEFKAKRTLFVDDKKENTDAAAELFKYGIYK